MGDYETEQTRLEKMMQDVLAESEDEEIAEDSASDGESDNVETRDVNSDTEQEISDSDEILDMGDTNNLYYIGKDGHTQWKKHAPNKRVKTRKENKYVRLPMARMGTSDLKEPLDIFRFFVDDTLLAIIVDNTNCYIDSIADKYSRESDSRRTDKEEVQALIGLLYYAGILKASHLNARDLWRTDGGGVEIFRLTMSLNRFRFLLSSLRFDDKNTREVRRKIDKLAPIREYFDHFVENCKTGYSPSGYVTVDEKLEGFRGRCGFRQYIPSKPNKYGIKIFALADAKMYYTVNMEVYVGLQPEGPYKVSNSPQAIVERLCEPIYNSNRNLTVDNWFTSINLIESLLAKKITVVGTIRKNKRELPLEFSNPAERPIKSSMFGFGKNCTLVSYIPKKKKNVLLVSSMHHDDSIDTKNSTDCKPEIIMDYNSTKGGVDIVDQLCANYNCARTTNRWSMVIFYATLNVAGINSLVVYGANNPEKSVLRRKFLRELAMKLILPHLRLRINLQNLPKDMTSRIRQICGITTITNIANPRNETGRCNFCDSKRNRKTRYFCRCCKVWMCLEHSNYICDSCYQSYND